MNPNPSNLLTSLPKTVRHLFRTFCVVGLALGIATSAGLGQTLPVPDYIENFNGSAASLPDDWAAFANGPAFVAGQTGSGQLDVNSKGDGTSGSKGSVFYTGDSGAIESGIVENAIIEAVFIPTTSSSDWIGVIGRAQTSASFNPSGYYALLHGQSGKMGIWSTALTTNGASQTNNALAWVGDISLQSNTPYRLILEMAGTQVTASLYGLDAEVGVDAPLAIVTVNDSSYSSGVTGVTAVFANYGPINGHSATYDSFSLTVIPEPSTAALGALAMGIGFLVLRAGRRAGTAIG